MVASLYDCNFTRQSDRPFDFTFDILWSDLKVNLLDYFEMCYASAKE